MKWIEILRKDNYALLQSESDTEYAVVTGYDPTQPKGQQWEQGIYFTYFQNNLKKMLYLQSAYDCFMNKVNKDYIPRCRLEELATLFKDGLISDDRESAMEYFNEVCEMTDEEKSFFEIEEDSPIVNTKFENPMYNKGYDDGFSDGANADIESERNMKNMIKNNECIDSDEYVALITGKFPCKEPTLKEVEEMELEKWNYPLTEIDHIMENEIPVILVRFPSPDGGYDYRFCETDD